MIRVLHITTHAIQYQVPLFRKLTERNRFQLTVAFTEGRRDSGYFDSEFGAPVKWNLDLVSGYRGIEAGPGRFRAFRFLCAIWPELRGGVDIVWLHGYASLGTMLVALVACAMGIKVAVRGESTLDSVRRSHLPGWFRAVLLKVYFRCFTAYLAIGRRNRRFYQWHGCAESRIHPAPYVVDGGYFCAEKGERAEETAPGPLRDELQLPRDSIVSLFVGKLIERKGPRDILLAVAALELAAPGNVIAPVFVGDGVLMEELKDLAAARNVRYARFVGFKNQDELRSYYEGCDFLVMPSYEENWGLVSNEALVFGKPIVCTERCGCVGDVVRHGFNGVVYRAGDVRALERALRTMQCEETRRQFSANAATVKDRYSLSGLAVALEEAFQAIVETNR